MRTGCSAGISGAAFCEGEEPKSELAQDQGVSLQSRMRLLALPVITGKIRVKKKRAAGVTMNIIEHKLIVLRKIAEIFNQSSIHWAVGGSLLLYLK